MRVKQLFDVGMSVYSTAVQRSFTICSSHPMGHISGLVIQVNQGDIMESFKLFKGGSVSARNLEAARKSAKALGDTLVRDCTPSQYRVYLHRFGRQHEKKC